MGVLGLWSIIEAAGIDSANGVDAEDNAVGAAALPSRSLALSAAQTDADLQSRPSTVLCVDLSVWIMEANMLSAKIQHSAAAAAAAAASSSSSAAGGGGPGASHKHHLVYLLQRVCAFLRNNIRLIFVTDGRAPIIKARIGVSGKDNAASTAAVSASTGAASAAAGEQRHRARQDPRFAAQIRDSTRLLQLLDLPVLTLDRGEAEALAGALNSRGLCDGVLTTDGDAFLFGARRVLKNLEASSTALQATSVDLLAITKHTALDREALVALALLLGSDYTSGVRSLGPRKAVKYLRVLQRASKKQGREAAYAAAVAPASHPAPLHSIASSASIASEQHPLLRIFRAVIDAPTPAEAVAMLLRCHEEDASSPSESAASSSAAAASSSAAAAIAAPAASSSPVSPSLDYASLSLADLKAQMAHHGLKAQSKAAMVAKLQQIAAKSPVAAAAAAASLSPPPTAAASSPALVLSDSDDDDDPDSLSPPPVLKLAAAAGFGSPLQSKPGRKPKGGGAGAASSKQRLHSLSSFLSTYVSRIHARYHPPPARAEMELIIASYLRPELHPKVEVLEKAIHTRIPSPNFMALRAFLASECSLSFVRFEKLYLPVELHLHLWSLQHAAWAQAQCREAMRALQEDTFDDAAQETDDDVIECTPPTRGEKAAAAAGASASSTSTVPLSGSSSSSSAAAATSQSSLHYTPSYISKRRVVGGCPYFVLVWTKTALGSREIASLPQALGAGGNSAAAAPGAQEPEEEQAQEEELDLTLSQSPVIALPAGSPRIAPSAAAAAASSSAAAVPASSKRLLLQDTTLHLFEAPEPAWFVRACLPDMAAAFESAEVAAQRAKQATKEQSKIEKQAAKDAKEQAKRRAAAVAAAIDGAAAEKKPRAPRKKKGVAAAAAADASTPSITSFLSPLSQPEEEESPPCPVASLDPLAPAEVLRKQLLKHRVRVEVDAGEQDAADAHDLSSSLSSSGRIEFKSIKGNAAFESLARDAPTIMASIIKRSEAAASSAPEADAYAVTPVVSRKVSATIVERKTSQQSTLRGFVSQSKIAAVVASASSSSSSDAWRKKEIPTLPPRSATAAKAATQAPTLTVGGASSSAAAAAAAVSSPVVTAAAAASASPASTFSSTLSVCPLCCCAFPVSMLQSHVNSCLDDQQEQADAAMAMSISAEPPSIGAAALAAAAAAAGSKPSAPSAAVSTPGSSALARAAADADDDDDDFNLSAELAERDLVVVSDQSAAAAAATARAAAAIRSSRDVRASSPARRSAVPVSARSKPLTPQKRKQGADAIAPPVIAAPAAAGVKPQPASSAARTLIDLLDSDDDDDEQPGSTLYRSSKQRS